LSFGKSHRRIKKPTILAFLCWSKVWVFGGLEQAFPTGEKAGTARQDHYEQVGKLALAKGVNRLKRESWHCGAGPV
jgi:hypothetical protein